MSILFINGSPNKNGNTAALAAELLKDHEYETLNLTDYTIGAFGQNLPGDELNAVIAAMKKADTIVIGSPVYWHNICGSVRVLYKSFDPGGDSAGHSLAFFWDTGLRGVLKSNCDPAYDVCGHIGISWTWSVLFINIGGIGWGCDAWRRALYFEIL